MGEDAGKENSSKGEIDQLRLDVSFLRKASMEMQEELLTHRSVLEQCLELREGVQELLQHREALTQCLELQDGIQAVLASAKILSELRDREQEHELSLAGVSDNTARHGKAISTLTEQQKRTSSTLDAVVRAVKRLARSRSRSRSNVASTAGLTVATAESSQGRLVPSIMAMPHEVPQPQLAYLPPVMQDVFAVVGKAPPLSDTCVDGTMGATEDRAMDLHAVGNGRETDIDDGLQVDEWWRAPEIAGDESQPRLLDGPFEDEVQDGDWEELDEGLDGTGRFGSDEWQGWTDEDRPRGLGNFDFVASEEEPRFWSGSSSCGSEARSWRASAGSRRPHRAGSSRGSTEVPDHPSARQRRRDISTTEGPIRAEMANCVQGVLSRIEEALTKLDSGGSRDRDLASSGPSGGRGAPRRVPRSWATENGDTGSDSHRRSRPHSARASTPRGGGSTTPRGGSSRARPGNTPYRQQVGPADRLKQAYSNSDRWA